MKYFTVYITAVLFTASLAAQSMPADDNVLYQKYPFVRSVFNRILNSSGLDSFYQKLYLLKSTGTGTVSVVHIGDSHIQADFMTGVIRTGLQNFFGDAGRGLVFPYQLARSNAPDDITSHSTTSWQYNRLSHPEIPTRYGISGYGIKTNLDSAGFSMSLRNSTSSFNSLKLFIGNLPASWMVDAENNDTQQVVQKQEGDSSLYQEIKLEQQATRFSLSSASLGNAKEFYGISLENSKAGVLYHSIGVNGARYDQYNAADLFWQQLPALNADLFIISLGTNEAQFAGFNQTSFHRELNLFLEKLKQASPEASILITTAPDSYRGRRFNPVLQQLNNSLAAYCDKNYIPFWDLYHITNGYGSASNWSRRGLMSRDRIHFTPEGYRLQGSLLLIALSKGYNDYSRLR